jgi:hypothetical protein
MTPFSRPKSKPSNKPKEINDKLVLLFIPEDGGNSFKTSGSF